MVLPDVVNGTYMSPTCHRPTLLPHLSHTLPSFPHPSLGQVLLSRRTKASSSYCTRGGAEGPPANVYINHRICIYPTISVSANWFIGSILSIILVSCKIKLNGTPEPHQNLGLAPELSKSLDLRVWHQILHQQEPS